MAVNERVTPEMALWMLASVHRRPFPPNRALVLELAGQMLDADIADRLWRHPPAHQVVLSMSTARRAAGVIEGVEALLALVYVGQQRLMLVERCADPATAGYEPDPELGPVTAPNGVVLATEMAITVWVEDPGPSLFDTDL